MFYCNHCAHRRGWPQNTMLRSYGSCELCRRRANCNDVPSSYLPVPTPPPPLPDPHCELGYTHAQIEQIMGERVNQFHRWMAGQTVGLCEGRRWNHETGTSEVTDCGPHGVVIYRSDVQQFLEGGAPLD